MIHEPGQRSPPSVLEKIQQVGLGSAVGGSVLKGNIFLGGITLHGIKQDVGTSGGSNRPHRRHHRGRDDGTPDEGLRLYRLPKCPVSL